MLRGKSIGDNIQEESGSIARRDKSADMNLNSRQIRRWSTEIYLLGIFQLICYMIDIP